MNRRGFALLTALWTVVALATVSAVCAQVGRQGSRVYRNRTLLARADWARDACGEIVSARLAAAPDLRLLDTVELGRGTWCRATVGDPGARLNVNVADPGTLRRLLGDTLADVLMDWRDADTAVHPLGAESAWYQSERRALPRNGPLADTGELRLLRGFEQAETHIVTLLTTRGTGMVNLNAAPLELVAALPGMHAEALEAIASIRARGGRLSGLDDLGARMSRDARDLLAENFAALAPRVTFAPTHLIVELEGGVRGTPIRSHATLTAVPLAGRLAIVARESD